MKTWKQWYDRHKHLSVDEMAALMVAQGLTVSGGCGATGAQNTDEKQQQSLAQTMQSQAQQVFGASSSTFNDLMGAYSPIVAAGPNQKGFSPGEESNLNSQAITQSGVAARNAMTAVKEANAAEGGGNTALPGGAAIGTNLSVANSASQNEANELNQINEANYQTGRQNFFQAATGLNNAPNAFNAATSAGEAATNSGVAASNTANQIAQENNSWVTAVTGALGGIAGDVVSGGMKNLGNGKSFFGGSSGGGNSS